MVFRQLIFLLLLLSTATYGQNTCIQITKSNDYYSASATNTDETEARTSARSLLIEQISTTVSSRTDLSTNETTSNYQSRYSNSISSVSQLYMSGIQYQVCARDKHTGITVMAYISKEDLLKSKEEISRKTGEYLELMEQKKLIGADFLPDAYAAYLHTFLTPYPIAYSSDVIKTNDVRTFLESFFTSILSKIKLTCTGVEENKEFQEQLVLNLKVEGIESQSMKFVFNCPEFNSRCEILNMTGGLNVLMNPSAPTQTFKGMLTIKPLTVSSDLLEIDRVATLEREFDVSANMMTTISVDFSIDDRGESLLLIPSIKHLSIRNFKWSSRGHLLSTSQRPVLSRKDIDNEITLTINDNPQLSITRGIDGSVIKPTVVLNPIAERFKEVETFSQLQPMLSAFRMDGKISYGKKDDFINPSNCWVFIVDQHTQKMMYLLTPESAKGRTDVKSTQTFTSFETQLKGLTSIWAEFY
ncbi:MAG: hypothetical protein WDO15_00390 [Bacteroidota bacterium]